MAKKSGNKSNEKVLEQNDQATSLNRGEVNEELKMMFTEIGNLDDQRKKLNDVIRSKFAKMKDKYGLPVQSARYVYRMRRMDPEARASFETSVNDINHALGYQPSLDLVVDNRSLEKDVPAFIRAKDPISAAAGLAAH